MCHRTVKRAPGTVDVARRQWLCGMDRAGSMTRQARAEATYQAILAAAADVFSDAGYCDAPLAQIISRAGVTRGAFHYHFSDKPALASALIRDADNTIECTAREVWSSSPTASTLENLLRSTFAIAANAHTDERLAVGIQLKAAVGRGNLDVVADDRRRALLVRVIDAAMNEKDIRPDLRVEDVAHTFWVSTFGNHLYCHATGTDSVAALTRVLRIFLKAVCTDRSRDFFELFVYRLAQRHSVATASESTTG